MENNIENKKVGRPKKEDRNDKEYYKNFIEKHGDELKKTIICPICGGSYKYFNKTTHNKTKKHLLYSDYNNIQDDIEKENFKRKYRL
jgi:hypothetical protein